MPDLNDLKVGSLRLLKVLVEEGSTQKAAARLQLPQSNVSYELKKLRQIFDDPLFIRSRDGLVANDQAQLLYPQIAKILGEVEDLYNCREQFDPASYHGTVTIAVIEPMAMGLMPKLFSRIHQQAPGVELRLQTWSSETLDQLRRDQVDLAIHNFVPEDPLLKATELMPAERILACRPHHPILRRKRIALLDLIEYPWLIQEVHNPLSEKTVIERVAEQKRLNPRILGRSNYLPALVEMLRESNAILYSSQLGMSAFQERLALFPAPRELEYFGSKHYALCSAAHARSSFIQWLIQEVRTVLQQTQLAARQAVTQETP